MRNRLIAITIAALTGGALLAMAPVAQAGTDTRTHGVATQGNCSGNAQWKLHVSPENGRLQVEFEVHQATVGDRWVVRIRENVAPLWSGSKNVGPDG